MRSRLRRSLAWFHRLRRAFRGKGNKPHSVRLWFDVLEVRELLSTVTWTSGASGSWETAASWTDNNNVHRLPTASDDVFIQSATPLTVSVNASDAAKSVTTNAGNTLSLVGGSLTIGTGTSQFNGDLNIGTSLAVVAVAIAWYFSH